MLSPSQSDYRNTELDPELLLTPFKVQTNWHVITGTSCSGKTTLIDQLSNEGFQTVQESGRQYFESELAKGRTMDEIRRDRSTFTRQVYAMMLERERIIQPTEVIFLDRALPDAFAFFRFAGINPNEILSDCFQNRYATVFMLDRLTYQKDGIRAGDDMYAEIFDLWMSRDYHALGYNVVRVPVLPPEERLAFVLERLSD
jgi:predicted ATPase